MTLNEYLDAKNLTDAQFAALINRDRTTVLRWRHGRTQPDWSALQAILVITEGAVTPNDFITAANLAAGAPESPFPAAPKVATCL